ncbi:MAG: glycine cleavage system aminomethyltransferase GcvT [Candidatus Brocadiaceae bacterium]|nr:glycine cleavage system aminomethyltransferase GcvT [Candidatus Brocadiaceae bacterium]
MSGYPFAARSDGRQSAVNSVCDAERHRQWRTLVMIPSESICHPQSAAPLAGELGNIYAEGLPQPLLSHDARQAAYDVPRFASWRTRLSDKRFYKGTENADRVELIAHDGIARAFGRLEGSPEPDEIYVNVQALSGAAANLSVYEALLKPGDRIMGLELGHGGHLTHGSPFNLSGRTYEVHSYGIDEATRRLDYERIRAMAREVRPRMIVGGASAYPWDFDWAALRDIADEVGALLLADVAHLAGLVVGGAAANPLPHADVVTFTTHKTICGPRGAVILTTDPAIARRIDMAVFPGLQGGPHMNTIAGIARHFELILEDYEGFRELQRATVENTRRFGELLSEQGFTLEYGGTNTHMLLVDLKSFPVKGTTPLDGEIASRLLELAGVVCNKNMLAGDADGGHASGLRFGLTWLTQRGVTEGQLREIADIVRSVLGSVHTCTIWSPAGERRCRGRVRAEVLESAAVRTEAIARQLPYPPRPEVADEPPPAHNGRAALLLRGDKVRLALGQMLSARLPADRTPVRARMFNCRGEEIDDVIAFEAPSVGREERWWLFPHAGQAHAVVRWVRGLSEGYLLFDEGDLQAKIDGPTVVEPVDVRSLPADVKAVLEDCDGEPEVDLTKPYFIGQPVLYAAARPAAPEPHVPAIEEGPLRRTVLHSVHVEAGAKMVPFAGWEMPVQYPTGIFAEHRAVRTAAGLFDVSHMCALEVSGVHAQAFLDGLVASCVSRLDPGEAQYSCILSPDGLAIDDVFVYRLDRERFMIVANAANADRVKDWIHAVASGRCAIDEEMPARRLDGPVRFRDLRDAGEDSLAGLALQGPASTATLTALADAPAGRRRIRNLSANQHAVVTLAGMPVRVARTGYTGEIQGFEVYLHPDRAVEFWQTCLEAGRAQGVVPAGLGARDSTRIEAGFPLFGHELEGDLGLSMTEAGYGFVPRFHVPFFIGRAAYMRRTDGPLRGILRLSGQGRKTLRAGHVILDEGGRAVGQVTSFAYVHEDLTFIALACVEEEFRPSPGDTVRGARVPADACTGAPEPRAIVDLTALRRFPSIEEKEGWSTRYAEAAAVTTP